MKKILERVYGNRFGRFPLLFALGLACLVFGLAACGGGGGGSSAGGNDSETPDPSSDPPPAPDPKYKLVFREASLFPTDVEGSRSAVLSPDGRNLYFTSDRSDRLGRFQRDASTGALTFDRYWHDPSPDADGLEGAAEMALSPDGRHLYVTAFREHSLARYTLDATGDLTFDSLLRDGSGRITGLEGATGITFASDGNQLYVATDGTDDAVTFFTRDALTGALTQRFVYRDGAGVLDGLGGAKFTALSPDGKNLYATGFDDDALVVFNRNASSDDDGNLILNGTPFRDNTGDVDGLDGANEVVVSPDGKNVYVVGVSDFAVAVFNRNTDTGGLTFARAVSTNPTADPFAVRPTNLAISPDGRNLYVSASQVLIDFDRNAETGELTPHETIDDNISSARGIVLSSDGRMLYVAAGGAIIRFSREER